MINLLQQLQVGNSIFDDITKPDFGLLNLYLA